MCVCVCQYVCVFVFSMFIGFQVAEYESVAPCWWWAPLMLYIFLAACALFLSLCVAWTVEAFVGQCPLYSSLHFTAGADNKSLSLVTDDSVWGDMYVCNLTEYLPLFVLVFVIVWFVMFGVCGRGGKGAKRGFSMPDPWRIVFPAFVLHLGVMFSCLVCAIWISEGFRHFCYYTSQLSPEFSCQNMDQYVFEDFPDVKPLKFWMEIIIAAGWCMFVGLMGVTILLMFRCLFRPDLTPVYSENTGLVTGQQQD